MLCEGLLIALRYIAIYNLQGQTPSSLQQPNPVVLCCAVLDRRMQFGTLDNLYCRYTLSFGNDWYIVHVSALQ